MAKRTGNSSVNSSIREGTKTQEAGFTQLLELQKLSNEHLGSISDAISTNSTKLTALVAIDALQALEQRKADKTIEEENDSLNEIEASQKELIKLAKANNSMTERELQAMAVVATSMKTFKTVGEKLGDMKKSFGEKYGKGNIGRTALSAVNVGGLLNKKIAQSDFIKQQKALGSTKTDEELKTDFAMAHQASKGLKSTEESITKLKKVTGLDDDTQLAKTPEGKKLFAKKAILAEEYAKHDKKSEFVREEQEKSKDSAHAAKISIENQRDEPIPIKPVAKTSPDVAKEDITKNRKVTVSKEDKNEAQKVQEEQIFILKQIVTNTGGPHEGVSKTSANSDSSDSGGGVLGGLGNALAKLGAGAGKGLGAILSGIGRGLMSLAPGLIALTPAIPVILTLAVASMALGKALGMAAPAIEAFAPVLMKVAEVVGGVFIEAIKAIPEILKSIGDVIVNIVTSISDAITGIMDSIVTSIERLGAVDGSNLISVGAGLVAVGAGMAAFGAGGAVAGVANLVTGFLGAVSGKKSPIEQLEQIASYGPGLAQAGIGMEKLSQGLSSFGSNAGSKVSGMSSQIGAMKEQGALGASIVSAPSVTTNVKQTAIASVTSNVRTHESSVDRYFSARSVY